MRPISDDSRRVVDNRPPYSSISFILGVYEVRRVCTYLPAANNSRAGAYKRGRIRQICRISSLLFCFLYLSSRRELLVYLPMERW